MRVLDVGCGVGGPAREIAKFTGCHITGLNINHYQVDRATRYAKREDLSDQLDFVQGDFMVSHFLCYPSVIIAALIDLNARKFLFRIIRLTQSMS